MDDKRNWTSYDMILDKFKMTGVFTISGPDGIAGMTLQPNYSFNNFLRCDQIVCCYTKKYLRPFNDVKH